MIVSWPEVAFWDSTHTTAGGHGEKSNITSWILILDATIYAAVFLFPFSIVHFNTSLCYYWAITLPLILTRIIQRHQSNMNLFSGDLTLHFGLILV